MIRYEDKHTDSGCFYVDSSELSSIELYHVNLLLDANYIRIVAHNLNCCNMYITEKGRDFIDKCRNQEVWDKVMKDIERFDSVPSDILNKLLVKYNNELYEID